MNAGNSSPSGHELLKLTRARRNGEILIRHPTVDAEIRVALGLAESEARRRASIRQRDDPDFFSPECLVYLLRDAYRRGDESQVYALWSALAARISPYVESALRTFGAGHAEEGVSKVLRDAALAILDLDSDRGDFFQISFWTTIERRTIDEFRRQLKLAKKDQKLTSLDALPGEEGHLMPESDDVADAALAADWASESNTALEDLVQREVDAETAAETTARVDAALATLPELVRQAFILHVKEGWQIESKNPNQMTISRALDRSPRQIRNYLKEADTRLRKWREGVQ